MGEQNGKPLSADERLHIWKLFGVAMLVALLVVALRLDSFTYYDGKYLWAEDGNVFLNEARQLGLSAILEPYAGYLHLFPRLVAATSQLVPLIDRPAVLLVGWFVALAVMVHALVSAVWQKSGGVLFLLPLVALALLQPNQGEVFFSITNAQWLLGAALCLYGLADSRASDRSLLRNLMLIVLCLTGPFAIVLAPVLILKLAIVRDWRQCWRTYVIICMGAVVQLCILLSGERISSGSIDPNPWAWIDTFMRLLFFGAYDLLALLAAMALWLCMVLLLQGRPQQAAQVGGDYWIARLLLITGFLFMLAGLFAQKQNPQALILPGSGTRYTWVPYILFLTSLVVLGGARKVLAVVGLLLFALVCYINFHRVERLNLQFAPFASFSRFEDVTIPINPAWAQYPSWFVAGERLDGVSAPAANTIALTAEAVSLDGLTASFSRDGMSFNASSGTPNVVFSQPLSCASASAVGLNIYLSRADGGWTQLLWSDSLTFSDVDSLFRWYPAGDIKAQYAFPLRDGRAFIRFDPMERPGQGMIRKLEFFCL